VNTSEGTATSVTSAVSTSVGAVRVEIFYCPV
jgi:hypothetical protein